MHRFLPLFAALILLPAVGRAEPRNIRISWTQPDTAHTMTVTWTTDSLDDPSVVQYGYVAPGQFQVEGESFQASGDLGVIHTAELTDLKADTVYQYRVGDVGQWSEIYEFRTGPEDGCKPFKFAALGDNRPDADWLPQLKWNPILEETVNAGPEFLIHGGDIVKDGQAINQWNDFLENSTPYFAETPFMAAIGNHDDGPGEGDSAYYNQIFAFPRNSVTETEDYYYFTYGDAIFVSLSTQTCTGGEYAFAEQAAWLDQVLTENPKKWKFVNLHHPPFTSHAKFDLIFTEFEFNHPPNEKNQNPALVPIFDKHHVDIVFAGHNHYYERFNPLNMGSDPSDGQLAGSFENGTVYVITGGAGALVYDEFDIPWVNIEIDLVDWVCGTATGSDLCVGDHHYVLVEIDDNHLTYEAWATSQQTVAFDPDNAYLIDSFDIYKAPNPDCDVPVVEPDPVEPDADIITTPDVPTVDWQEGAPEVMQPDLPVEVVPTVDLPGTTELPVEIDTPAGETIPAEVAPVPAEDLGVPPVDTGRDCGCRTWNRSAGLADGQWLLLLLAVLALAFLRGRQRT